MTEEYAIDMQHVSKGFGKQIAVDDVTLQIKKGEIFGLLGPNGAGKTTTLRMMTTLLPMTSGSIAIFGHDVTDEAETVRTMFGLTGQYASVDEDISARENLMIFSRLNGLSRAEAKARTAELLREFSLEESADKAIADFSGGMRRRLDLAVSLIARPALFFLDEPTTGLDPRTRTQMWQTIRDLVAAGSTIVLTTQYLEEADELADRVALIDHGKLVSLGTPDELKAQVGGTKLLLTLVSEDEAKIAVTTLDKIVTGVVQNGHDLEVGLAETNQAAALLTAVAEVGLTIADIKITQPTLDDVFFAQTVGKN
jgi:ABC-2 type transport system ATP-binding protein